MTTFITNWAPVKMKNNKKLIVVFAEFNLVEQDVKNRETIDNTAGNEAIISFDVSPGTKTGKFWYPREIYLSVEWDQVPVNHKIRIKTYDANNALSDDDSMETSPAPSW